MILGSLLRQGDKKAFEEIRTALAEAAGNVFRACAMMEVPHRTFMKWRKTVKGLEKLVQEERRGARRAREEADREEERRLR